MRTTISLPLTLLLLPACSPSRTILDYVNSSETGEEQASSTTEEEGGDTEEQEDEDGSSTTDDPLLDFGDGDTEQDPCVDVAWLTADDVYGLVGPAAHDGRLYWGEWSQGVDDPIPIHTWRQGQTILHSIAEPLAVSPSLVVDATYLYASGPDHTPYRFPVGGGFPQPVPPLPGYDLSSSELELLEDHLYWLNHTAGEIRLIRTELSSLDSVVLLDELLGDQLAVSEEAGLFVIRAAGQSTDILQVDPLFGTSEVLISVPATSTNVGELYVAEDSLFVVYTSVDTAQVDRVTFDGVVTTLVEPGTYTLITHPLVFQDHLYFEFATSGFTWGRVGLDHEGVEPLFREGPYRWQPMVAFEDCLVYRVIYPMMGNNTTFEINVFP
jgi:hypothetical protein